MAEPTPPGYRCNWPSRAFELAANVVRVVDVPIGGARSWTIAITNTGANPLTSLSVARIPITQPAAAVAASAGIPLAAGDALPPIVGENAPLAALRLQLRSTLGTTVTIEAGGV